MVADLNLDRSVLRAFLKEVRRHYHANPYHNWVHGVDVLCAARRMVAIALPEATALELLALLLAAVCHDVNHAGVSNAVLKSLQSEWALLYDGALCLPLCQYMY